MQGIHPGDNFLGRGLGKRRRDIRAFNTHRLNEKLLLININALPPVIVPRRKDFPKIFFARLCVIYNPEKAILFTAQNRPIIPHHAQPRFYITFTNPLPIIPYLYITKIIAACHATQRQTSRRLTVAPYISELFLWHHSNKIPRQNTSPG